VRMAEIPLRVLNTNVLVSGFLSVDSPPARLVDAFFGIMNFRSMVSATPWPRPLPPDSSDTMFLEVAHSTSEKTLITGNLKHFPASCRGQVRVHSPREALVMLTGRA
ncbi:MAG: hypothetical protein EBY83_08705, partial [Verrucomicrobia bacterium]|nr:hypothetical protein [Verrucomicrobiota bacterium]